MDNLLTLYHGGSVEKDVFGNITFDRMHEVSLIFNDRLLFSEVFGRAHDELQCISSEDATSVKRVVHFDKSSLIFRRLVAVKCEVEWKNHVKTIMKNEYQCLDLVVRKFSNALGPRVHSAPNVPAANPPSPNLEVDQEDTVAVPDVQSGLNEFGICPHDRVHCRIDRVHCQIDDVGMTLQEIPLTRNRPSKCGSNTTFSFVICP
jgi:hypothetical protein